MHMGPAQLESLAGLIPHLAIVPLGQQNGVYPPKLHPAQVFAKLVPPLQVLQDSWHDGEPFMQQTE